jgi:hypothetical protein
MDEKELKQKIRKLKRLELKFRYGFSMDYIEKNGSTPKIEKLSLVWKDFFDLGNSNNHKARYSLPQLKLMDKEQIRQVIGEFWFWVYYRMYQENGLMTASVLEPELLEYLGLPYDSDQSAVRKRFRELCREYHPDEGGNADKFIELMKIKEKYEL